MCTVLRSSSRNRGTHKRFATFPIPHPFIEVLGMIPAELRRRPANI